MRSQLLYIRLSLFENGEIDFNNTIYHFEVKFSLVRPFVHGPSDQILMDEQGLSFFIGNTAKGAGTQARAHTHTERQPVQTERRPTQVGKEPTEESPIQVGSNVSKVSGRSRCIRFVKIYGAPRVKGTNSDMSWGTSVGEILLS